MAARPLFGQFGTLFGALASHIGPASTGSFNNEWQFSLALRAGRHRRVWRWSCWVLANAPATSLARVARPRR
jgi:hypothetical protein